MKQYDRFIFDSYTFDPATGRIELHYSMTSTQRSDDELHCTETLQLPISRLKTQDSRFSLDRALFALHLIGGISYFKTCLPKTIEIRSGALTPEEAAFWNQVYENGLGEFFFKNDIDCDGLIQFPVMSHGSHVKEGIAPLTAYSLKFAARRPLVPIGGGKDSIVTIELLKAQGKDITLLRMGAHPLIDALATIASVPMLTVQRSLSPLLFELNTQGALNGHIPITAYLSILSVVVALLHGHDAVVMSNERSADEGNVLFKGKEINHQWSKSLAFEQAFQAYLRESIGTTLTYFSLLRPWNELQVVEEFVKHPEYFHVFTSCNKNWKILDDSRLKTQDSRLMPRWCGYCPKCAFVFLLLAAHLPRETVVSIFGRNLFEDESLRPLYEELLGLRGHKPFECVGTPEETREAFALALKHDPTWKDTTIVRHLPPVHAHR